MTPPNPAPLPLPQSPTPQQPGLLQDRRNVTGISFALTSVALWALQKYVFKGTTIDPQTAAIITAAISGVVGYATSHFLSKKGLR